MFFFSSSSIKIGQSFSLLVCRLERLLILMALWRRSLMSLGKQDLFSESCDLNFFEKIPFFGICRVLLLDFDSLIKNCPKTHGLAVEIALESNSALSPEWDIFLSILGDKRTFDAKASSSTISCGKFSSELPILSIFIIYDLS
ncbi:unnamed protein product [Moneuplotes crassus]|uniref:Uncharacterized protein n=1 Tax=Euplotes crassus TaxID=5936 RepID=A0AAD1X8E8_EUPCR|nr:unnamed protein product [Moneuplotes crassus]